MYFTGKFVIFFGIFAIGWAQNAPAPSFPEAPEVYPEAPAPFYPEAPEVYPEAPAPFYPEAPSPFYPEAPEVNPEAPSPFFPEAPAPLYPESPEVNPESPSPFFPEAPEFYPGTPEVLDLKRSEMERMDENATWMLNETLFEEMDRMNWTMEANFTDY